MLPGGAKGVASGGELWYYHSMKTTELTTEEVLSAFGQRLLPWFYQAARDLPWRHTDDPYAIWVSEIMLQQTRVEAVKPYFARFIQKLPDVAALAAAPEERIVKLWEGLGITAVSAICRKRPFRSWKNMMVGFLKILRHFSR